MAIITAMSTMVLTQAATTTQATSNELCRFRFASITS